MAGTGSERQVSLTLSCRTTYVYVVPHRQPPDVAFYILFNKYTYRIF